MSFRSTIPRFVYRTPSLWAGAILLTVALVLSLVGASLAIQDARFAAEGATADGIVLSKDTVPSSSSTSYVIRYRFAASDDRTYEGSSRAGQADWERLAAGDPVTVQYLVSDPSSNRLPGTSYPIVEALLLVVAAGLALGGGALSGRALRRRRQERRLMRVGTDARATVSAFETTNFSTAGGVWDIVKEPWERILYAYRDATGIGHEGRSWMMPGPKAHEFKRGDHATIRYDPDRPAESLWMHARQPAGAGAPPEGKEATGPH